MSADTFESLEEKRKQDEAAKASEKEHLDKLNKLVERLTDEVMEYRAEIQALRKNLKEAKWKSDPAMQAARSEAIHALVALLPNAVRDARKGKPALLRLIIRSLK